MDQHRGLPGLEEDGHSDYNRLQDSKGHFSVLKDRLQDFVESMVDCPTISFSGCCCCKKCCCRTPLDKLESALGDMTEEWKYHPKVEKFRHRFKVVSHGMGIWRRLAVLLLGLLSLAGILISLILS